MARLGRAIPRRFRQAPVISSAAYVPGEILDIGTAAANHFLLQYAETGAGSPSVATQADIAGGFSVDPYFVATPDGQRVQLWARLDAPTTGGASFSRSELREVNADGTDAAWDANDDVHELRVKFTPTHLPAVTPAAVFAQMFDTVATADRISIRTQLVSGTARLRIRINGSTVALDATSPINPGSNDLATGVNNIVGVEWDVKVVITGGAIQIFVNDMVTPVVTRPAGTLAANGAANYFKTGIYNQANTGTGDAGTDWGSSEIRDLAVTHTDAVFPTIVADLPAITGASAATVTDSAVLAAVLPELAGQVAGTVTDTGELTASLPEPTAITAGTLTDTGGMPCSLPALTGSITGTVTGGGETTTVLPTVTAAFTTDVRAPGTLTASLPVIEGTSAADTTTPGDAAGVLPAVEAAITGTVADAGVLEATLPALSGAAEAETSTTGALAAALPALAGTHTGVVTADAELSTILPTLLGSMSTSNTIDADLTAALPELAGSAAATVAAAAQIVADLPALAAVLTGTVGQPGATAGQLPTLAGSFTAAVVTAGTLTGVLPALVGSVDTAEPSSGALNATLPVLTGLTTGTVQAAGVLSGQLPLPVAALTGAGNSTVHGPLHASNVTDGPHPGAVQLVDSPDLQAAGIVDTQLHAQLV